MAASEKIEQGVRQEREVKPSQKAVAAQNENSYAMLGQMTGSMGLQKKPKGRKSV